jgi:NFU1 iron-sulfur cluster scaffold homolog, mitochondrial
MMKEETADSRKAAPVEVYAELTPNPESMKFVTNRMLLGDGVAEYSNKEEAIDCPLAFQLFDFSGVKRVFITGNFLTITKEGSIDWFDITNILREFVRGFLLSGEKVFIRMPDQNKASSSLPPVKKAELPSDKKEENQSEEIAHDPEIEEKIKQLLDEYVRPAVEGDGGAIHFESFVNGTVNVVLKGACSGCPSSTSTLKGGIENLLKRLVPEVKEVVALNE